MIGPKLSHSLTDIAGVPAEQLDDAIRIYRAHYLATGIAQSRLYPGIRALLEAFVDAGRPIAVATQKPEGIARTVLEHHGIAGLFHTIRGSAATRPRQPASLGEGRIVAAALADLRRTTAWTRNIPLWWGTARRTWPEPLPTASTASASAGVSLPTANWSAGAGTSQQPALHETMPRARYTATLNPALPTHDPRRGPKPKTRCTPMAMFDAIRWTTRGLSPRPAGPRSSDWRTCPRRARSSWPPTTCPSWTA